MDTFTVLSDPTRRQIVETLATGERSFGELAECFEMSRPAVSQHLKLLRDSGMVTSRAEAQRRIYRLESSGLDELQDWLTRVRQFWNSRLDALERELSDSDD